MVGRGGGELKNRPGNSRLLKNPVATAPAVVDNDIPPAGEGGTSAGGGQPLGEDAMLLRSTWLCGTTLALLLIGTPLTPGAEKPAAGMTVDKKNKTITIDAQIAPRKLPVYKEIYPIEVVACWAHPKGQKAHETIVTLGVKPSDVHKALESFGLKPGKPILGEGTVTGPEVKIFLEVPGPDGKPVRMPIEETLIVKKTGKTLMPLTWHFTGSAMKFPDPEKDDKIYGADQSGTLVTVFPVTDDTVIQAKIPIKEEATLKLETNTEKLPKVGTPAKLIIEAK
jgi:hypothetical protein